MWIPNSLKKQFWCSRKYKETEFRKQMNTIEYAMLLKKNKGTNYSEQEGDW